MAPICGHYTHLNGCGRTDAGVHASSYIAHFDAENINHTTLLDQLNAALPETVHIREVNPVPREFHAQRSARSRTYVYRAGLRGYDGERLDVARYNHRDYDLELLREIAMLYGGHRDFAAFCRRPEQYKSTRCDLSQSELVYDESTAMLSYMITGNRFLHNMVRLLVARMLDVGRGALSLGDIEDALANGQALKHLRPAYAQGLTLEGVAYS